MHLKYLLPAVVLMLTCACSGENAGKYDVTSSKVLTVDQLTASPDSLVGMNVTVEGNCTRYGMFPRRRIYLRTDTDTVITHQLRCDATPCMGGVFPDNVVGRRVRVTGLLQKGRIDEGYITFMTQKHQARQLPLSADHSDVGNSSPDYLVESTIDNTMMPYYSAQTSTDNDSAFDAIMEGYRQKIAYYRETQGIDYIPAYYIDVVSVEIIE